MQLWDKLDRSQEPTQEMIRNFINNPLWEELCDYVETNYQSKPVLEYSGCSIPGWNIKYKKAGRSLCTLYPMNGFYIALIVIGERELTEVEFALPFFTEYLQKLYHETKTGMGQKWLLIEVRDSKILADVKKCIAIRRCIKKKI